jgi:hypothetical protein
MAEDERTPKSEERLDPLGDSTRAWWTSVLTGEVDSAHPIHGDSLKTRLEGETLIISGTVSTEEDRAAIGAETEHLKGHGVTTIRNGLEVVPELNDQKGLLTQTLIGVFENAELARFAQGYLQGHAHVHPQLLQVISPDPEADGRAALRALVPELYWEDAEKALDQGRGLLILAVDETEAFKARELLDEETRSLRTFILPPEATGNIASAQQSLDRVTQDSENQTADQRMEAARQAALRREAALHES